MSEIEEGEIVQDKDEFEKEKKNKVFFYLLNIFNLNIQIETMKRGRSRSRDDKISNRNKHDSPCKYFLRGECKKGEKCNYKHLSKKEIPCKYFHGLGSCENTNCE